MTAVAIHVDLRSHLGPARDQLARPTCLSFAMSDAHSAARGGSDPLSIEYLFYQAKQVDKTPPTMGATIPAAKRALEVEGQPLEPDWPYQAAQPDPWNPPSSVGSLYHRASADAPPSFDTVWQLLEASKPVVVGMTLSTSFFLPDKDGVVDAIEPVDPTIRHAVLAVGSGWNASQKCVLIRNSWGPSWGLNGHAWLSETYVAPRLLAALTMN